MPYVSVFISQGPKGRRGIKGAPGDRGLMGDRVSELLWEADVSHPSKTLRAARSFFYCFFFLIFAVCLAASVIVCLSTVYREKMECKEMAPQVVPVSRSVLMFTSCICSPCSTAFKMSMWCFAGLPWVSWGRWWAGEHPFIFRLDRQTCSQLYEHNSSL